MPPYSIAGVSALLLSLGLVATPAVGLSTPIRRSTTECVSRCRVIPGDAKWPGPEAWNSLNGTVGGRLIQTVPVAHVCHDPSYSAEECQYVADNWLSAYVMTPRPGEFLSSWFQNQTCVPHTDRSTACDLGNYASYSLNVSGVDDVKAGLDFAQKNNVRLVIKNSGHDFYGKSTGKGALALWTRNLNHKEIIHDYSAAYYQGPALKIGAGVNGGEAGSFAAANGYRMVGGSCPTVGPAGGYTQGGGHSFLTGLYGFGADNVLEWEVVTALGDHLIATPEQNSDLYWALSGGGGGTYGVVVSMTVRVFPDGQVAMASLTFSVDSVGGVETYWQTVERMITELRPMVDDHGMVGQFLVTNDTTDLYALIAPDVTSSELSTIVSPVLSSMAVDGITPQQLGFRLYESHSYYELYARTILPHAAGGVLTPVTGGRFVTGENVAANATSLIHAMRATVEEGRFYVAAVALNSQGQGRLADPIAENAMQEDFKHAYLNLIIPAAFDWYAPWEEAHQLQDEFMDVLLPLYEEATPGAGAYLNEANWAQATAQDYHGDNYERLREVKAKYDPNNVFYGLTGVGSEAWAPDAEGRLCRTGITA
ncbi:FAD-binding domain-containing protein [Sodiomyces alkalinus F11]|uniref:FAD-binding domain-containing protein n=1 Tax=Sodiomyces alkalinus (strain CBS 110278 / VKM F-3762 / F11) TaxID=1314773 RepID=A0A3N2PUG0_SODAK|nr:FAD-binding domain-containing protein [Sodiomyces alkalinus F11]ROT38153.1 FAD-binding domain-containing protein [Sodiomyces alkalinus F11]